MFRNNIAIIGLLFILGGCSLGGVLSSIMPDYFPPGVVEVALTPRQEYAAANAIYETLTVALTRLGEDKVLSVPHLEMISPILHRIDEALDLWETSLIEAKKNMEVGLINRASFLYGTTAVMKESVEQGLKLLQDIVKTADKPLIGG